MKNILDLSATWEIIVQIFYTLLNLYTMFGSKKKLKEYANKIKQKRKV